MLQETSAEAPLGAPHNLASPYRELVARYGHEAWHIIAAGAAGIRGKASSLRRQRCRNTNPIECRTECFRDAFVIGIDRVAKKDGVVGRNRISEFIVVKDRT